MLTLLLSMVFFSWGSNIGTCSTDTYLTDIISFLNTKAKYPTSGGICYFDVNQFISGTYNFTSFLNDIAVVSGNTISSDYLTAWTPNYPPATPTTITFNIAVTAQTTYDQLITLITNIFTQNNFNLNQITITIVLTLKRSSPTAQVTVTTTNPSVATTLTQQIQDSTSPLNQQLNAVGPVSGVTSPPPPPGSPSSSGSPSSNSGVRDYQSASWLFVVFGQLLLLWWYLQ